MNKTSKIVIAVMGLVIAGLLFFVFFKNSAAPGEVPNNGNTAPGKTVDVAISAEGFSPATINVEQGDIVRWTNNDTRPRWPASDPHPSHTVYGGFDPEKGIEPGKTWEFRFDKLGSWEYHDHLAPAKRGQVIVGAKSAGTNIENAEIKQLLAETDKAKQAKIVYAMAEKYGPKETLAMMRTAQLPYTGETHLLVHEIGNVAYKKYADKALLYCDDSFLSACYHGVIINELGDHGL
jgi:plastocyanin